LAAPAEPPVYVGHPTNEIGHILALARDAGYDELADLITAEDYGRASAALAKMEKGLFPWRMAVTNGYQHGFLLYALKGYILEKSNDPPKAYRQYQNSRGCLDDDVAMMYYPQPRLEVLIGIGRTCNAVGRYTDSKDYLDVARIEGSEYVDISALADRALIRRGVEIGDYPEVTNLYNDLRWLSDLTRGEHKEAAQILFWSHDDRAGFSMLLQGLTKLGIDNDLGVKDPMVDCFLNNLMRADDQEISYFYDLLGYAIVDARALEGDEKYLAFLCNSRMVMAKLFHILRPEDDIKKALTRVDQVKAQLLLQYATDTDQRALISGTSILGSKGRLISDESNAGLLTIPALQFEDLLMRADWNARRGLTDSSMEVYIEVLGICTNEDIARWPYDGTTISNAALLGRLALLHHNLGSLANAIPGTGEKLLPYVLVRWPTSRRLLSTGGMAPMRSEMLDRCLEINASLPYPVWEEYCYKLAKDLLRWHRVDECIRVLSQCYARLPSLRVSTVELWASAYAAKCEVGTAFAIYLDGLAHCNRQIDRSSLVTQCLKAYPWASCSDLARARSLLPRALLAGAVDTSSGSSDALTRQAELVSLWANKAYPAELTIRAYFAKHQWHGITNALSGFLRVPYLEPPLLLGAVAYWELGLTNEANKMVSQVLVQLEICTRGFRTAFNVPPETYTCRLAAVDDPTKDECESTYTTILKTICLYQRDQ
jgi:hypothetical protein